MPSPDELHVLFSLSRSEWERKVLRAAAGGSAIPLGTLEDGLALGVKTRSGNLIALRPDYSQGEEHPALIEMLVVLGRKADKQTAASVQAAIKAAAIDLGSEFELAGEVEDVDGVRTVVLVISKAVDRQ